MNNSVLLSLVGASDPIRNNYDGPMLHICRVMHPKKVYLLLTEEMHIRDKLDNRYERAIKEQISNDIEVVKIPISVTDVYRFDVFFEPLLQYLKMMREENEGSLLLVNITSGTTQFISALALMISYSNVDILPIQVISPENSSNKSPVVLNEFDLDLEFEYNIDNNDAFENRSLIAELGYFSKLMIISQIKGLVGEYQYFAAQEMLRNHKYSNQYVNTMLAFANDRLKLIGESINVKLDIFDKKEIKHLRYCPFKQENKRIPDWYRLIEYFAVVKTKSDIQDYSTYLLMLEPFASRLYEFILEKIINVRLNNIFDVKRSNGRDTYWINPERMPVEIKDHLESSIGNSNAYGNFKLEKGYVSNLILIHLIRYYCKSDGKTGFLSDFDQISEMLNQTKNMRNSIAHDLVSLTHRQFIDEMGFSADVLNSRIELFIVNYFNEAGFSKSMFYIYDDINKLLVKLLNEMV